MSEVVFPVVVELAELVMRVGAAVKVGLVVIKALEPDSVDEVSALVCAELDVVVELLFANACRGKCRASTTLPIVVKVHRCFIPILAVDRGRAITSTMSYLSGQ